MLRQTLAVSKGPPPVANRSLQEESTSLCAEIINQVRRNAAGGAMEAHVQCVPVLETCPVALELADGRRGCCLK